MNKVSLVLLCLVLTVALVLLQELKRVAGRVDRMAEIVFDIDMEVSRVTAVSAHMGFIGERMETETINGEPVRRKK